MQSRRISSWLALALVAVAACESRTGGPDVVAQALDGTVLSADGVPIRYESRGSGATAVVLVHGWACDRSYWAEQVQPLAERYRVVTVDLGGHGESGLAREEWTIDAFGGDVAAVVEELELESVVLVGHSMGGDVIFEAARHVPSKVLGLVMVDTYKRLGFERTDADVDALVAPFEADFPATTERFVRNMFPGNADPELANRVATDMASAPPPVAIGAMRSSLRHASEMPALLRELDEPVVAINADDAPTDVQSMREHGVEVVIMPGAGHFLMLEDPERFNRLLAGIIDDLAAEGANGN